MPRAPVAIDGGAQPFCDARPALSSSCPRSQPGLRRLRKLACAGIHVFLCYGKQDVDGIATRPARVAFVLSAASRVYPTCGDKPGHDEEGFEPSVQRLDLDQRGAMIVADPEH